MFFAFIVIAACVRYLFAVQEESILGGFFGTVRATDPAGGTMLPSAVC